MVARLKLKGIDGRAHKEWSLRLMGRPQEPPPARATLATWRVPVFGASLAPINTGMGGGRAKHLVRGRLSRGRGEPC